MNITPATNVLSQEQRELTPESLNRLLNSPEGLRVIPAPVRRRALDELTALKRALEKQTCSQTWLSDCWEKGQQYPPHADTTAMVGCACDRCAQQGKLWPAHYVTTEAVAIGSSAAMAYECYLESLSDWEAAQLPSSPSGLALRAIREGRIKLRIKRHRARAPKAPRRRTD